MLPVSSGLELRMTLAQASQRTGPKLCVGIARQATKATLRLNNLGQAYNLGNGVEKDTAEAARWWQKAAEQGLAKAQ
jgi:TPR repeat protein